ncbi:MAG TPA: thioredoxin family protein, partial [Tepidisphaeraceae bacterium]|nr:thioredoxin family protein [Tepidisphaeraceae bacterium]
MPQCNRKAAFLGAVAIFLAPAILLARRVEVAATKPSAPIAASATQPSDVAAGPLPWFTRFADALDASRRTREPIFVDVGADWCVWCRRLDAQINTPAVQQRLRKWTRLRLD